MSSIIAQLDKCTPEEVKDFLEGENIGVETQTFVKPLTEIELDEMKEEYMDKSKKLFSLKEELKRLSDPLNEEMKPLKSETTRMMKTIHKGGKDVTEDIYLVPDYQKKIVYFFTEDGMMVGQRPFTSQERQLHLNSLKHNVQVSINQKDGTNN